jgi:hypothetical protein
VIPTMSGYRIARDWGEARMSSLERLPEKEYLELVRDVREGLCEVMEAAVAPRLAAWEACCGAGRGIRRAGK